MAKLPRELLSDLNSVFDDTQLLTDTSDLWAYGYDNSRKHCLPDAVIFASEQDQVQKSIQLCNQYSIPIVARGRGTGTTGGALPIRGGIVLSLERMTKILKVDAANRTLICQPGVLNQSVQDAAAQAGFFWPPDPSSAAFCTVGGNLAYNSAGPRAVKYGTPRENVLGLKAITGQGDEIRTGVCTTKGVVGYDLTRLLIGSEGTLAVITEAILKLSPLPESRRTIQAIYKNISDATHAVIGLMSRPVTPCALEFLDGVALKLIQQHGNIKLPKNAGAMLIIEVDGLEAAMDTSVQMLVETAKRHNPLSLSNANSAQENRTLWESRKALSPILRNLAPNKLNEDVVVPVASLPDLIGGLETLSKEYNIQIVNFGHAGNGNIHVNLLYDSQDPQQQKNALPCLEKVFDLVLSLNGTLSGEHGVGTEKQAFVSKEIQAETLELMKKIKQQFDPNCILNPGKMFPQ